MNAQLVKSILEGLKINVPDGSAYLPFWHVPYRGITWTIADEYEFFGVNHDPAADNYADKHKLTKAGAATIFGLQLVLETYGGTYAQERQLFHELIGYGRLELRKGEATLASILSSLIGGVDGGPETMGCAANDTTANTVTSVGHVRLKPGFLGIPGGILVENSDQFNIRQKFIDDGARAAVNALNALNIKYGVVAHAMVHEPGKNNPLGCPIVAPAQQRALALQ